MINKLRRVQEQSRKTVTYVPSMKCNPCARLKRIETPRDRDGSFEPLLLPKHAHRFTAFDDSIVARYARGLTVHEIQRYLSESCGTEVSPL